MFEKIGNILSLFFKKPLKVGMISYYYPVGGPSVNGVSTHVYFLSRNLAKLGCEVHIFTVANKHNLVKERIGDGKIIIHPINLFSDILISDLVIKKRLDYSIFENKVLNQIILESSRAKFDIIHTHGWLTSAAFMLKHFIDTRWVHTFHAIEKKRLNLMTEHEKKFFRITEWMEDTIVDADRLIAVSNESKKEIINSFENVSKKIRVIPNGVDLSLFKRSNKNPPSVLYIGRFSKEKGIHFLPDIVSQILNKHKTARFTIIAERSKILELQEVANKFSEFEKIYKNRFNWVKESVFRDKLFDYYSSCGIYLQPSLYESFGLCILEAMACGKAVVATNVGGISETVGNAGVLCNPNAKDLSKNILKLLKNPALRKKYGKLASERAKQFDWEIIAQKTLDLYLEIINEKSIKPVKINGNK